MCDYCNGNKTIFSDRDISEFNPDAYTGLEVWVCMGVMGVLACLDNKYVKPLVRAQSIKINYCPMCGRKLDENV